MKKLTLGFVFLLAVAVINVPNSSGYPWIYKQFRDRYLPAGGEEPTPEQDGLRAKMVDTGCQVCHAQNAPAGGQMPAGAQNDYAQELAKILGNAQQLRRRFENRAQRQGVFNDIDAALEEVGEMEVAEGHNYDDLMESGFLPYEMPAEWGQEN